MQSGEVWHEIAEELMQESLRPVSPDRECISEIMHTYKGKAELVLKLQVPVDADDWWWLMMIDDGDDDINVQHQIIDEQQKIEEIKESHFYDTVLFLHWTHQMMVYGLQNYVI